MLSLAYQDNIRAFLMPLFIPLACAHTPEAAQDTARHEIALEGPETGTPGNGFPGSPLISE